MTPPLVSPLTALLRQRIAAQGPISVAEFMGEALGHPQHGYYRRCDPLGVAGDFITAPEISQMFGELIGLWCAVVWQSMGSPSRVVLAELGPGRGTLMADLLRAARQLPAFRQAVEVHLVETSQPLREKQAIALQGVNPVWHEDVSTLPSGPLLLVANEFLDALPIRQWMRSAKGWRERLVGLDGDRFVFVEGPVVESMDGIAAPAAKEGDIFEVNEPARAMIGQLAARLVEQGGAALIIDYGAGDQAIGDSLQAVRSHAFATVLDDPGMVDLTAHVDFQAVAEAAGPAKTYGPVTQGAFLRALGIELRAEHLIRSAPTKAADLSAGCRRLIDGAEMGTLFKVIALTHPDLPPPPAFGFRD